MPRAAKQPDPDADAPTPQPEDPEPITEAAGPVYLTTADLAAFLDRYDAAQNREWDLLARRVPGKSVALRRKESMARARAHILGGPHAHY